MIILLIILFAALVIVGFFYLKGFLSWLIGVVAMILLALTMIGLVVHDTYHWGMKPVTTTSRKEVFSAGQTSAPYGMLLKSEFGTDSGNYIFMYRDSKSAKDLTVNFLGNTKSLDMSDKNAAKKVTSFVEGRMKHHLVETSRKSSNYKLVDSNKAEVVTKTTRWEFSSGLMKTLFGVGGEEGELKKQVVTVDVPKDTWLVLTQDQAKKLEELAPKIMAQQQAEVEAKIAAAPTPEAKMEIAAAAQAQAEKIAEMQKNDPEAYAKMMVEQMKKLLDIKD